MNGLVLVAGATGHVGGRLWRRLEQEGRRVRCLGRLAHIVV
ncbi:MAG: NAD-dependent epimerase/dehydratase family protein [bacterium]|uniref:NAD-dependent epimerase/dehydratase family protein n=1 Tax=Candidatus Methylomirabilis tolerans TaxID=3123416 RepID=A0AAJ1EHX2_9BACT|nr:NAD-dependent epimerase/dehydratase family protein [Candidatus Methylomirabilis sp.]